MVCDIIIYYFFDIGFRRLSSYAKMDKRTFIIECCWYVECELYILLLMVHFDFVRQMCHLVFEYLVFKMVLLNYFGTYVLM